MTAVERPATYDDLVEGLEDGAYCVDRSRRITAWNTAATRLTGYGRDEAMGKRCWHNLLRHVDDEGRQLCRGACPLVATMEDGQPREAPVYLHHRDGHRVAVQIQARPLRDELGAVVGAVETFRAIERAEPAEPWPPHGGDRDQLTGLPGVETARLRLERWLAALARGGPRFGLVGLRIDAREQVARRFGPEVYEAIVRAVAATLTHALHAGDVAARAGEDAFLVLIPDAATRDVAAQAHRLRFLAEQTFLVRDHRLVRLGVRAGSALGQPDERAGELIERAFAGLEGGALRAAPTPPA